MAQMFFESSEDIQRFANRCGYEISEDGKVKERPAHNNDRQRIEIKKFSQSARITHIDQLKGLKSRCDIMQTPLLSSLNGTSVP
jgi:hypothetical protein